MNMLDPLVLPQDSTTARLLIVDDESNIRLSLVRALNLLGYSVEGASSGPEALTFLERASYDLMVLDMHLPDMDGVEVMHRARQLQPELLIIVLTGHATLENAIAAVKLEAVDYLCKPVSIHEVANTVAQVLQKQSRWHYQQHLVHVMGETLKALRENEMPATSPLATATSSERFVSVHPLTLDRQNRLVAVGENPVQTFQLTEGETDVLAGLMTRPNQVLSCRELVRLAWDQDLSENEAESVVRPYIFRLRRKLEVNPKEPRLICTVRKLGYLFASTETSCDSDKP